MKINLERENIMNAKIKDIKNECKKISWPTKMTVARNTAIVLTASIVMAGCIAVIDYIFQSLIGVLL